MRAIIKGNWMNGKKGDIILESVDKEDGKLYAIIKLDDKERPEVFFEGEYEHSKEVSHEDWMEMVKDLNTNKNSLVDLINKQIKYHEEQKSEQSRSNEKTI